MTIQEKQDWAAKSYSRNDLELGTKFVLTPSLKVKINYNNDNGEYIYAICVAEMPEFWMEAKETLKEAKDFCKKMGWEIIK